jgi:2,4-dienoyl-CoA reductase-like NADH-dependent reductase (Old Yellow Enzyme family)
MTDTWVKVAQLKTSEALRGRLAALGLDIPVDERILTAAEHSPMAQPLAIGGREVGNRWCIHPMEGWDAELDGSPSPHTLRRWRNFGLSGAKLLWGGEAAAVQPDGRANPRQTLATAENEGGLRRLLDAAREAHRERFGRVDDWLCGLQLTHSGRYSKPMAGPLRPRTAWRHPLLDRRCGIEAGDDRPIWTDIDLEGLIDRYVAAAGLAWRVGFDFVDIKACHGYLLHEFLGARDRPGPYGGDFAGRTRLLTTIIERIRERWPALMIGVRLSFFDLIPFESTTGPGRPSEHGDLLPYRWGFGVNAANPLEFDLEEPLRLVRELRSRDVVAVNLSCGSPYYNPHIQRPAAFPPSDGYQPPEDPLVGVARQIQAVRQCKEAFPTLPIVGTGYSYLQDFLPNVAQAVVRAGWVDSVGLGRMVLSYPELPFDCLQTGQLRRKLVCRTFSDCTTGPRKGLISGCYPLDPYYKALPEAGQLRELKSPRPS